MEIIALQMDLARQKEDMDFIKEYVHLAKENGYNTIFLYLEASVRTKYTPFFKVEESYSLEEMAQIVAYIEGLGMDVIPAFENLYHMEKFFQYPQLEKFAEFEDERTQGRGWASAIYPHGSVGCISNMELRAFMDEYIQEVCSVFHSKYVHMGLDEIFEFADCPRCQERIQKGEKKIDMFFEHTMHCYDLCKQMGKRMMMWDDFFEYFDFVERLPRDIILCDWQYVFVAEEPRGHWANRIKRDWLRLYDELGFEYLACFGNTTSSTPMGFDTYQKYVSKFKPMGKMMVAWERESRFYQGLYPCIAYAGQVWSGKIKGTNEERINLYASFLGGNRELAKLVLATYARDFFVGGHFDLTRICEGEYVAKHIYLMSFRYLMEKMKEELQNVKGDDTVARVIYYWLDEQLQLSNLRQLGNEIFDGYEVGRTDWTSVYEKLDEIEQEFQLIRRVNAQIWERTHHGVISTNNALENRSLNNLARVKGVRDGLDGKMHGVLYLELMLQETYNCVKGEIFVQYEGEEEAVSVFKGSLKPGYALFDVGGCYTFRLAIENRPVKAIVFDVFGEGSIYPLNFKVLTNGKKLYAKSVEKLYGAVEKEENVLSPDTQFAIMGYERAIDHLNDGQLWKVRSGIKVTF